MKERRFSKRATIITSIVILVVVVILGLSIWSAFSALLPSPTNPWQAMRSQFYGAASAGTKPTTND